MKYLGLILKNLFRNKRRTLLTIVSIAVSLFIFSALTSLPIAVNQVLSAASTSRRLVVHNKAGLAYGLPPSYLPKLIAVPHVEAAVAQCWFGGIYHEVTDQFPNWALDLDGVEKVFPDWGVSQQAWDQFKKQRRACLVGPETLKRFNFRVGQHACSFGGGLIVSTSLTISSNFSGCSVRVLKAGPRSGFGLTFILHNLSNFGGRHYFWCRY